MSVRGFGIQGHNRLKLGYFHRRNIIINYYITFIAKSHGHRIAIRGSNNRHAVFIGSLFEKCRKLDFDKDFMVSGTLEKS